MKRGFYTIMAAQFFSSLADNALFVAAIELLKPADPSGAKRAALVPMFALFYVILAPFVGAFADSRPKGQVMLISNSIKIFGCLLMLFNVDPLLAYAIVGLGAAAYSPAKYGILTELLPASQLVKANGWIEGLTIGSIILGVLLGGQLVGPLLAKGLLSFDLPLFNTHVDTPAEAAICVLVAFYLLAAWFNTRIPLTGAELRPMLSAGLPAARSAADWPRVLWIRALDLCKLLPDFWSCNLRLWRDKLGQISLTSTSLIWGVSGNLRYIVLAWAAVALGYSTTQATSLVGVVALGTAVGAVVASMKTRLDQATSFIPLGILMGALMVVMIWINNVWVAAPFLIVLGAIGGFLVVPMNALLQHRGHNLMGAGRSIAVQNFNEQLAILGLGFAYSYSTGHGLSALAAIAGFGTLVAVVMWLIGAWHKRNLQRHPEELVRLNEIARNDNLHG